MPSPRPLTISAEKMQKTLKNILLKLRFPKKRAEECAAIFTQNSIDGIYTHGINRFPRFVQYIQKGYVIPDAKPTRTHRFAGVEQWNGNLGAGPSNAIFATERAMKLAEKYGIGCVALAHTNHWMRGGAYGWQAAKAGFTFIGWTNTTANMPAWGATNPKLGNNPLVFAAPYGNEAIVLDMAMSQYSFGAMELAVLKNEKLSVVGGYDKEGNLTNEPDLILESWRSLPVGFWKGAGLSFLLDVLAAILSNGLATHEISQKPAEMACSQVFIAIDMSKLANASSISSTIDAIIEDYKTSIPIKEQGKISYPSERVLATRHKNSQEGIPVLESVWQEVSSFLE
ncbi:3-dehydro-L-gulonate 2-dehydrogenase [Runella sp.]|uniref:3-dehydro-L-gulonate 2-dehydrogenase n=1 Tax=Runella sp. TaxID=1960881 RepID=UPI003D0CBC55